MATITTKQVTTYSIRARKLKLLGDAQKEDREEILAALIAGATIPTDGPYVLDLSQNGGKDFSWEDEFAKLRIDQLRAEGYKRTDAEAICAKEMHDKYEAAPAKAAVTIAGFPYVGGVKLTPKVNAKAKAKVA